MSRGLIQAALWLILAISLTNGKVLVEFSENSPGTYFRTTEHSHGHLTKDDLTAVAASLLNVGALSYVDSDTANKVGKSFGESRSLQAWHKASKYSNLKS